MTSSLDHHAAAAEPEKRRGIQMGQVVFSGTALSIHESTAEAAKMTLRRVEPFFSGLSWVRGLNGDDLKKLSGIREDDLPIVGVYPDGGIFLYRKRGVTVPVMAIEAKHQGNAGNAIERWFKNQEALSCLGSQMSYLTICTGDGARLDGIMRKILMHAFLSHARQNREKTLRSWGRMYYTGPSFFSLRETVTSERLACLFSAFMLRKLRMLERN